MQQDSDYVIPTISKRTLVTFFSPKMLGYWLILTSLLDFVLSYHFNGYFLLEPSSSIRIFLMNIWASAVMAAVPFFGIRHIYLTWKNGKNQQAIWQQHTFAWYRNMFPQYAPGYGEVSCRFCGSRRTRTRNLMGGTYMRVHSCNQCGETLYFSKEQV